jgi:UDP-2-acetamido-2,6-beta-L-arabino-hexul-4-ose reductase
MVSQKKYGRELFEKWSRRNSGKFTGLVIPNIFGPFGHPYYNSVVATFCHQLSHNETPNIEVDSVIKLIYVSELIKEIMGVIELNEYASNDAPSIAPDNLSQDSKSLCETKYISSTSEIKVSQLLKKLTSFKENYRENGTVPNLDNPFDLDLWNTFLCYNDHASLFPYELKLNTDNRGSFVEIIKLNSGGQISFSSTAPGVTRGNHFHTRKAERFTVIKGKARIELRKIGTEKKLEFLLDGDQPSFVDMPIWYTHNITNIGDKDLYTIFWINEFFDKDDPDTYFEEV